MKAQRWELNGYLKDLQAVSFLDDPDSLITSNLVHNRINFRWDMGANFSSRFELRNRLFYGEQVKMIPGFGKYISEDEGYFNLSWLWADHESLAGVSVFDRALLNYSREKVNVTAGRQRINWGVNTVWNPNDLFNAYNFLDFDYEERPGVDALRLQLFPKAFSSLELAYKPSDEKDRSVAAALIKWNKWKYDLQLLGGIYHEDVVVGAGWAGNIRQSGFKGEVSYFKDKNDSGNPFDGFTASLLVDYSFKKAWYVSASVLYVQNPQPVLLLAGSTFPEKLSAKSLMPYRHSFYAGVMKSFTPIFTGNLALIYAPKHHTSILFPTLTYNVRENFDLDLMAQCYFSDQSGEYRTNGNSVYLRLRWSFRIS